MSNEHSVKQFPSLSGLKPVYRAMNLEFFEIYCVQITRKGICNLNKLKVDIDNCAYSSNPLLPLLFSCDQLF